MMPPTRRTDPRNGAILAAVSLALVLGFPGPLRSQTAERAPSFSLSAAGGVFRGGQASFRALYGGSVVPLHLEGQVRIFRNWSIFAGFRHIQARGTTRIAGASIEEESYRLEFEMSSVRLGLRIPSTPATSAFSRGRAEGQHLQGIVGHGRT